MRRMKTAAHLRSRLLCGRFLRNDYVSRNLDLVCPKPTAPALCSDRDRPFAVRDNYKVLEPAPVEHDRSQFAINHDRGVTVRATANFCDSAVANGRLDNKLGRRRWPKRIRMLRMASSWGGLVSAGGRKETSDEN